MKRVSLHTALPPSPGESLCWADKAILLRARTEKVRTFRGEPVHRQGPARSSALSSVSGPLSRMLPSLRTTCRDFAEKVPTFTPNGQRASYNSLTFGHVPANVFRRIWPIALTRRGDNPLAHPQASSRQHLAREAACPRAGSRRSDARA
jgi:hypothetical protein